jgi:hypothetical protein
MQHTGGRAFDGCNARARRAGTQPHALRMRLGFVDRFIELVIIVVVTTFTCNDIGFKISLSLL